MRLWWVFSVSLVSFAMASVACVGDETTGSEQGSEGALCFPNETCNEGLRCISDVCVAADGVASSSGASGTSGAATSSGGSGGTTSCGVAAPTVARREIQCGSTSCSLDVGQRCCASATPEKSKCTQLGVLCEPDLHDWQCTTYDNCYAEAPFCCLTPVELTNSCPATAKSGGTRCAPQCEGPELSLCQSDDQCTGDKRCKFLDVVGPDLRAVGACL